LNVSSDGDDVTVAGKLFYTRAAATGKAQSPLMLLWCHYIATQSPIGGGVFGSGGGEYQSLCNSLLELD